MSPKFTQSPDEIIHNMKTEARTQAPSPASAEKLPEVPPPDWNPDKVQAYMDHVRRLANEKGLEERYGLTPEEASSAFEIWKQNLPLSEKSLSDVSAEFRAEGLRASAMGTAPKIAHIRGAKAPREE